MCSSRRMMTAAPVRVRSDTKRSSTNYEPRRNSFAGLTRSSLLSLEGEPLRVPVNGPRYGRSRGDDKGPPGVREGRLNGTRAASSRSTFDVASISLAEFTPRA